MPLSDHYDRIIENPLHFSKANSKLAKLAKVDALKKWTRGKTSSIYSFDLLAGHSCPFAKDCRSKAVELPNGKRKVVDGEQTIFRCYAASQEARLSNVYNVRKRNYDTMVQLCRDRNITADMIADVICDHLPFCGLVRIHSSGDFFNWKYFSAWVIVACRNPNIRFYFYTKAWKYVIKWKSIYGELPANVSAVASRGGTCDSLINDSTPEAVVVYSKEEAKRLGLEIDSDDSHAAIGGQKFALLIHGTQPKGSEAQRALVALKGAK
jgi:hypothetical protein